MRFNISVTNTDQNQPLVFHSVDGAIETAPPPVTPNVPAGGTAVISVRIKEQPVNPATPGALGGIGNIYYARQEARLRYYKIVVLRANGAVLVHRAVMPHAAPHPHTAQYNAWGALPPLHSALYRMINRLVHGGDLRAAVAF